MYIRYYINYLLILQLQLINTNEFATDMNMIITLKEFESKFIKDVDYYIMVNELSMEAIRIFVDKNKKKHLMFYNKNPYNQLDVYSSTRRLMSWSRITNLYILNQNSFNHLKELTDEFQFLTDNDILTTTIETFYLLQDVYKLSSTGLANGQINGIQYNTSLNSLDCFVLGDVAFKHKDYYHAILWMNVTLQKLERDIYPDRLKSALDILAESYNQLGDRITAAKYSDQLNKFFPSEESYIKNQIYKSFPCNMEKFNDAFNNLREHKINDMLPNNTMSYTILCREEQENNPLKYDHSLFCHYVNNNIPFLFIAPLKEEILSFDPILLMFHDVIYNKEIKSIQKLIKNHMSVSKVSNCKLQIYVRSSKDIHISYDSKILLDILKRSGDITKLNINSTEDFNVKYYEIGTQYGPHHDTHRADVKMCNINEPRRISTLMFYMNDVKQGGATVFPALNITVWPKKGSAIFWYNLYSSGQLDPRTIHAGCPVLVGSKWVSTVWNLEDNQEFYWPCVNSSRI